MKRHEPRAARRARSSTSGSARRRTRRATNGFARIPRSTRRSATRFGAAVEAALAGALPRLAGGRRAARSRACCCSTSSRATCFATRRARSPATPRRSRRRSAIVDAGLDRALDRYERWFLYLPFEHAEDLAMQERSLALFGALAARDRRSRRRSNGRRSTRPIVRRFGRYPHRNAILGRASTPEEIAFLQRAGLALLSARLRSRRPARPALQSRAMHSSSASSAARSIRFIAGISSSRAKLRAALPLAAVRFIPAGDPPHRAAPVASRCAPARDGRARRRGHPGPRGRCARDRARRGRSYTVLTLEELRAEAPTRPLALIVGADAFLGLPTWHRWREIFELAHVVVVARPGVGARWRAAAAARRRVGSAAYATTPRRCAAPARRDRRAADHRARDLRVGDTRAARARARRHRRRARFASGRRFGLY